MRVWIQIDVDEFEDFLDVTLDDLIAKHSSEMYQYLSQFLISMGSITTSNSSGKTETYRF